MIYSNYLRDRATAMIVMVNVEIFVIRACYTSGLMRCTKPCSSTYAAVLASKTYMLTVHDRYTLYLMHLPHPFENMHLELSPVNSINYVTVINTNDSRNFRMDVVYAFIDYITHQYFVSCQRKPLSNNWCQSWFCAPLPAKKWPVRIENISWISIVAIENERES